MCISTPREQFKFRQCFPAEPFLRTVLFLPSLSFSFFEQPASCFRVPTVLKETPRSSASASGGPAGR